MARNAFDGSIEGIKSVWGPLGTEIVAACRGHLEDLLKASHTEEWLVVLHKAAPANKALYRDPTHGFVLLAHTEPAGLYRPPHDHCRGWVIYAMQQGEIEMGTYARLEEPGGSDRLVKRGSTRVRPGQVQVYLPGDIRQMRLSRSTRKGIELYWLSALTNRQGTSSWLHLSALPSKQLPRTSAALIGTGSPRGCMYRGQGGDQFKKAIHLFGAGPFRQRALVVGVFARL